MPPVCAPRRVRAPEYAHARPHEHTRAPTLDAVAWQRGTARADACRAHGPRRPSSDTSATAAVVSTVLRSVCRSGRRVQRQPDRAAVCCIRHVIHHVVPCTSHATGHTARCTPRLIMLRALHGEAHVSPRVISCALHGGAHVSPRGSALAALTQVSSSTIVLLRVDASGTSCRTNTARTTTGTSTMPSSPGPQGILSTIMACARYGAARWLQGI